MSTPLTLLAAGSLKSAFLPLVAACGCAALAEAKTAHGVPASIRSRSRPAGPNCASTVYSDDL
jgi:hypothetical protein